MSRNNSSHQLPIGTFTSIARRRESPIVFINRFGSGDIEYSNGAVETISVCTNADEDGWYLTSSGRVTKVSPTASSEHVIIFIDGDYRFYKRRRDGV